MPVRFLSDAQREQLSGFPAELEPESLDRFFTLSGPDLAEVRRRHGDENRLGWSLQLCGLRMLGFCPDDVTTAPPSAVRFVARQLGVDPGVLDGYGSRAQTRTDHVNQVKAHLGFCSATNADLQDARDCSSTSAVMRSMTVCTRARPAVTTAPVWSAGGRAQAGRRLGRGQSQRPRFPMAELSTAGTFHPLATPGARGSAGGPQLRRPDHVSHQRPLPGGLPARTAAAALLSGFPCSEEIGDLLGRHRFPKTVKCKPHDGAAADDLPASAAHVRVLAFAQPQVVLAIQPHLARLERERDVLRGSGGFGLPAGCWSATRSPWRSWGCGCRYGWGPGGAGRRGRPGLGCSRSRRWRIAVARNSQIDYLGAVVLWLRARRRGGARMARRKRPPGSAGLLLLEAFAQLSHRIPPRS